MYIQVENVTKIYGNEENQTKVLDRCPWRWNEEKSV